MKAAGKPGLDQSPEVSNEKAHPTRLGLRAILRGSVLTNQPPHTYAWCEQGENAGTQRLECHPPEIILKGILLGVGV